MTFYYAAFFFVVMLVFVWGLFRAQWRGVEHLSHGQTHCLHALVTLLGKEQEQRQELESKVLRLIHEYLGDIRLEKEREREEAAVTPEELKAAQLARKKLERCFGLANSLVAVPEGPWLAGGLKELQRLLGEILLKGDDDEEEIDAVYEGRFPGSVEGRFCSDCGKPARPGSPLETIKKDNGEHRLVHKDCEEALEAEARAFRNPSYQGTGEEFFTDPTQAVIVPMGTETFAPGETKRFAVKLQAPLRLVSLSVAPSAGMWLTCIEIGRAVLRLARELSPEELDGTFSLASEFQLGTYPTGFIIKATFTNRSNETKTVAAALHGMTGAP